MGKRYERILHPRRDRITNKHMLFDIISHQGNAKLKQSEILLTTHPQEELALTKLSPAGKAVGQVWRKLKMVQSLLKTLAVSYKIKHTLTTELSNPTLKYL